MSLLVEIATRADVPLEAVVRVLTREPVSDDAKARVLAVLDELEPEQTRVVQRFALAAVYDTLPPPEDVREVVEAGVIEVVGERRALEAPQAGLRPAPSQAALLVQLRPVLGELAEAIRELRHETDAERRERVDDLAVLIDLITKGWEGIDRRLGRLERQLARLEGSETPRRTVPLPIEPPPVPTPPEPQPPQPPPPPPPDRDGRSAFRGRLPLAAVLALAFGVGAVAALDLPDRATVSSVSASTDDSSTRPSASRPPTTASVLGEVATDNVETKPPASRKPAPTTTAAPARTTAPTRTTPAAPARTTAPTRTTRAAPAVPAPPTTTESSASGFRPSRNWAWPPVAGADYYLVEFLRDGRVFYRARPTAATLTLPESVVFTPGSYRWRVRPGRGAPAANDLQRAVVDSAFTVGE